MNIESWRILSQFVTDVSSHHFVALFDKHENIQALTDDYFPCPAPKDKFRKRRKQRCIWKRGHNWPNQSEMEQSKGKGFWDYVLGVDLEKRTGESKKAAFSSFFAVTFSLVLRLQFLVGELVWVGRKTNGARSQDKRRSGRRICQKQHLLLGVLAFRI